MPRPLVLTLALLLPLAVACSSINAHTKARTDQLMAQAPGTHHEPAPDSYQVRPWAAGSWVAFKVVSDGKPSYLKMSVLSEDAQGVLIEQEQWDYQRHTLTQILYSQMPRTAEQSADYLKKIVTKTDDQEAQTTDFTDPANPMAGMMKGMMKSLTLAVQGPEAVDGAEKETVTVPAGTIEGAAKYDSSWSMGPITQHVTAWWHPAIPVNGGVKSVSKDGKFQMELLDYGWSGATSALK
jgi:hypothetical protein